MTIEWNLILRLFIAGLLGGLVGFEREFRAKEAGLRTHFIVALGSALFIGFLGAGVIIFQKNVIRGVTTAAGLWMVAAIGLAAGAGMYPVSIAATLMTVMCLEAMHFFHLHYGEKVVEITVASDKPNEVLKMLEALKSAGIGVETYSISEGHIHMSLRMRNRRYVEQLHTVLTLFEGAKIENLS